MIDVVTNKIKDGTLQEVLHVDDLVLIAETMAELQKIFHSWKDALENKGLKVNLMKTKVMVTKTGQINVRPSSKKGLCGICGGINNGKCSIM